MPCESFFLHPLNLNLSQATNNRFFSIFRGAILVKKKRKNGAKLEITFTSTLPWYYMSRFWFHLLHMFEWQYQHFCITRRSVASSDDRWVVAHSWLTNHLKSAQTVPWFVQLATPIMVSLGHLSEHSNEGWGTNSFKIKSFRLHGA